MKQVTAPLTELPGVSSVHYREHCLSLDIALVNVELTCTGLKVSTVRSFQKVTGRYEHSGALIGNICIELCDRGGLE